MKFYVTFLYVVSDVILFIISFFILYLIYFISFNLHFHFLMKNTL